MLWRYVRAIVTFLRQKTTKVTPSQNQGADQRPAQPWSRKHEPVLATTVSVKNGKKKPSVQESFFEATSGFEPLYELLQSSA